MSAQTLPSTMWYNAPVILVMILGDLALKDLHAEKSAAQAQAQGRAGLAWAELGRNPRLLGPCKQMQTTVCSVVQPSSNFRLDIRIISLERAQGWRCS